MGRKIPLVSLLCGYKKPSPQSGAEDTDTVKREDHSDLSNWTPKDNIASPKPPSTSGGGESPESNTGQTTPISDQQLPLPPPPGGLGHHMRTASCNHYHTRSSSSSTVSKLVSSMSMRVLGSAAGDVGKKLEKRLKHEDSVWKKTIILGEKCRVPDEDEDSILYDDKGNKISTYHPKAVSSQTSCIDHDEIPKK